MTPATLAATLLIVATLADIASTEYALRRGLSEGNPVAAKLMAVFGKFWGLPKLALAARVGSCNTPQSPPRAGFFTPARNSLQRTANSPISPLKTGLPSAETAPH
jgi:hypothetical protein